MCLPTPPFCHDFCDDAEGRKFIALRLLLWGCPLFALPLPSCALLAMRSRTRGHVREILGRSGWLVCCAVIGQVTIGDAVKTEVHVTLARNIFAQRSPFDSLPIAVAAVASPSVPASGSTDGTRRAGVDDLADTLTEQRARRQASPKGGGSFPCPR
jgi:hypothetical protein